MAFRLSLVLVLLLSFASQAALCQQPANGSAPDGQAIFLQRCAACHGEHGEGVSAIISMAGPPLLAVRDPARVMTAMEVGPSHMPRFGFVLTVLEMHAVAQYVTQSLAVMPLQGGKLAEGGKLYRMNCDPCHGPTARGGVLAFVGVNPPSLVNVDAPLIAGVIRMGPGPMPSFPPAVLSDQQVASIVKYVQFMKRAPDPGGSPLGYFGPVAEGFIAWMMLFVLVGITGWIEKGGKG
ncbi:MAG: c-type cytochrome [Candidatus Acidiferrales bacterium]